MRAPTLGRAARAALAGVDAGLTRAAGSARSPQLFILGLPRSGTTLIYQYLVHRLAVAYFTNGVGRLPRSPCVVTLAQRLRHGDYRSDFRSTFGRVEGPVAPREAGAFWGRFFGYEDYVSPADVSPRAVTRLRRTVECTQWLFGDAPFVNKNVKHMLRIPALAAIFPESRFLVVERDLEAVALSILRARHANSPAGAKWWSMRPPDHAALRDLDVEAQVVGQVRSLLRRLEIDLHGLDPGRVLRVDYASFCSDPDALVAHVRAAIGPIGERNPPEPGFRCSPAEPRTAQERRLLDLLRDEHPTAG